MVKRCMNIMFDMQILPLNGIGCLLVSSGIFKGNRKFACNLKCTYGALALLGRFRHGHSGTRRCTLRHRNKVYEEILR